MATFENWNDLSTEFTDTIVDGEREIELVASSTENEYDGTVYTYYDRTSYTNEDTSVFKADTLNNITTVINYIANLINAYSNNDVSFDTIIDTVVSLMSDVETNAGNITSMTTSVESLETRVTTLEETLDVDSETTGSTVVAIITNAEEVYY